ncbi:MAG: bifunctional aminoglycoside phosphotransferase/ATP-binding protein [Gammaproteobacteria bacterium]
MVKGDLDNRLISALHNPACFPHPVETVKLLETHISWVLLAGDYVYKIKKPVNFGFLDFSELSQRQFFCHEELRLNRRLAPNLYLDVIAIGGSVAQPVLDAEPAIEYAVKMRRFAEESLLDHLLARGRLNNRHMQCLAETMAEFHERLPLAGADGPYGNGEAVVKPTRQNFSQLSQLLDSHYTDRLARLEAYNEQEYRRCLPFFAERLRNGKVKECHGDLHLGNIVMLDERPIPFDGIEFNPDLRWIDVINDVAFLLMDLQHRQRQDLAFAFLNAYLQRTGDYDALTVLRFYLDYRAMVMAKVTAIRAAQLGKNAALSQCESYLALAEGFSEPANPVLMITHGLPGCGKTMVSQIVLEKFKAIRIRSDVERKRLFGLQINQNSHSEIKGGIYTTEATERTYRRLLDLCRIILQSGFNVIVDAAFLKHHERQRFRALAGELSLPFVVLNILCDEEILRARIGQRSSEGNDASEADIGVYETLKQANEALTDQERLFAVNLVNNGDVEQLANGGGAWEALQGLITQLR